MMPLLQHISQFRFFSKLDLSNAFWSVKAADLQTRETMAFTIPGRGQFTWNGLAQGSKNGPSIFQRFMDKILDKHSEYSCSFFDDIAIGGNTIEELTIRTAAISQILIDHHLIIAVDKCEYNEQTITLLGLKVSHNRVEPTNQYIDDLSHWKRPETATNLRRFLGKLTFIHQMYPQLRESRSKIIHSSA